MRATWLISAFSCLLIAPACDEKAPSGPTVPLNQEFTLSPGEAATVQDTSLRIQFLHVSGDSRCPRDAVCIQGGDALVHIRASEGGSSDYELHTGDESRAAASHGGFHIELINLQPYPFSTRTIQPHEYRAALRVSRP
jgi:hypothetical protein